ncbi:unnamed protein product [Arabis nemorensis]|uniref:Uncharacterized protein n=1 Tax=Arabis nemorensis TaxID=586526 RepID=A0A565BDX9_9BRAS|nr:unnamed protein product [Arabis nemorensis]
MGTPTTVLLHPPLISSVSSLALALAKYQKVKLLRWPPIPRFTVPVSGRSLDSGMSPSEKFSGDVLILGPTSSFIVPWLVYRCCCVAWSTFGLEELDIDDSLSVLIKGSTLISAADFKIVNPALVAVSITGVSSQVVFLISHSVIPLLRPYVVEIRGIL